MSETVVVPKGWKLVPTRADESILRAMTGWRECDSREGLEGEADMFERAYHCAVQAAAAPSPAEEKAAFECASCGRTIDSSRCEHCGTDQIAAPSPSALRVAQEAVAWYCEHRHKCQWQGFALHQGLSWGSPEKALEAWRDAHSKECGGEFRLLYDATLAPAALGPYPWDSKQLGASETHVQVAPESAALSPQGDALVRDATERFHEAMNQSLRDNPAIGHVEQLDAGIRAALAAAMGGQS